MPPRRLILLLPMYNEAECIGPLMDRAAWVLKEADFSLLIIDDGSTDGSAARVTAHPLFSSGKVQLLTHVTNRGLGAALATGLHTLIQSGLPDDTVVIGIDADNTHDPAAIPGLLAELDKGYDVVVASRYHPEAACKNIPWFRRALSRGAWLYMRLLLPVAGVRDYSCGYRAYHLPALRRGWAAHGGSLVESQGFSCMVELLIKLSLTGARISEAPILFDYGKKAGKSKIRVLTTVWGYLKLALALRGRLRHPIPSPTPLLAAAPESEAVLGG